MWPNEVAVVTGAASGLGRATAELFAREGARVVLADVDEGGLEIAPKGLRDAGGEARFKGCGVKRCEVSRENEVAALMAFAADAYGGIGTVVNNSSVSAFANVGGNVAYAAGKGAVMSLTRVLALEYARENIRVDAACPGVIDTGMNRRNLELAGDPEAVTARWLQATPLGRMGTPEEVAQTVVYLASSQSSFTTGVGLLIDGGRVAT